MWKYKWTLFFQQSTLCMRAAWIRKNMYLNFKKHHKVPTVEVSSYDLFCITRASILPWSSNPAPVIVSLSSFVKTSSLMKTATAESPEILLDNSHAQLKAQNIFFFCFVGIHALQRLFILSYRQNPFHHNQMAISLERFFSHLSATLSV